MNHGRIPLAAQTPSRRRATESHEDIAMNTPAARSSAICPRPPGRWLAGLLLALAFGVAQAAERVALLVGNGDYADQRAKLPNPTNDAKDLADALSRMGFKVLLRKDLDAAGMKDAIREFGKELEGASVALFFYAGHALQLQGNNFLLPVNSTPRNEGDVLLDAMDLNKIVYLMGSAKTRNIVILDACRDNPFKQQFPTSVGLAQMSAPPDTLIAYSTAPGTVAYDGTGRNSIYTRHLLRYIVNPEDEAPRVFALVGEAVQKETRTAKQPQVPWQLSSLRPNFYLARNPASATATSGATGGASAASAASAVNAGPQRQTESSADIQLNAERAFWESVNKSRADDLRDYLQRFPNGLYGSLAKRQLALLEAESTATAKGAAPARTAEAKPPDPKQAETKHAEAKLAEVKPAEVKPTEVKAPASKPVETKQAEAKAPEAKPAEMKSANVRPADVKPTEAKPSVAVNVPAVPSPIPAPIPAPAPITAVKPAALPPIATAATGQARNLPATTPTEGKIRFSDGSTYTGTVRNGLPHGKGDYVGADGYRYLGNFVNGVREGKGMARWPDGQVYEGDFVQEIPDGIGTIRFASGDVYDGTVRKGVLEGRGKLATATGNHYEGEFVAGLPHGKGAMKFPDGAQYEGSFDRGVMVGKGTLRAANGDVYQGPFVKGKFHGVGTLRRADGSLYEGQFVEGLFGGNGKLKLGSGDSYEGEFSKGLFAGRGLFRYAGGVTYEGAFSDGVANGSGVLTYADGLRFEGLFRQGLGKAIGIAIRPGGERVRSELVDGQLRSME